MRRAREGVAGIASGFVVVAWFVLWAAPLFGAPAEEAGVPLTEADEAAGSELAQLAALDPATGDRIPLNAVAADKVVRLPPGDIRCVVTQPDGTTPHSHVAVVLTDARTSEELMSATTDENGECVLRGVREGSYLLRVGLSYCVALVVEPGAQAGPLRIVLPKAAGSLFPAWAPLWMHAHPYLASVVVAAGGATVVAAPVAYAAAQDEGHRREIISPTVP